MLAMITAVEWLVGAAEIGRMFGVGRARVGQLTSRADFPAPTATLDAGRVWLTEDVRLWAQQKGRVIHED